MLGNTSICEPPGYESCSISCGIMSRIFLEYCSHVFPPIDNYPEIFAENGLKLTLQTFFFGSHSKENKILKILTFDLPKALPALNE